MVIINIISNSASLTLNAFSCTKPKIRSRRSLVVFVASNTWQKGHRVVTIKKLVTVVVYNGLCTIKGLLGISGLSSGSVIDLGVRQQWDTQTERQMAARERQDSPRSDLPPSSGMLSHPAELPARTVCGRERTGGASASALIHHTMNELYDDMQASLMYL